MLIGDSILNSPFEEPTWYWAYEEGQKAQIDPKAFKRRRGTYPSPSSPASTGALL